MEHEDFFCPECGHNIGLISFCPLCGWEESERDEEEE